MFSFVNIIFCLPLCHKTVNRMSNEHFDKIDKVIRQERLYANVDLKREDVMTRFGISRHRLNFLMTKYAGGMSFPQYINALRIEEANELITHHPEMSITEIAAEVGFTPPNLREQFKRQYGVTPQEYRQNL